MRYYLIGSEDGYNGLRFRNVADWQKYFGFNSSIAESWTAPDLEYIHRTTHRKFDISTAVSPLYAMSHYAVECIGEMLLRYGVLLPITFPWGYTFFYCTNIIDALIAEDSVFNYLDDNKKWIISIDKFTLSEKAIKGQDIFRIPQANYRYTFFSERFRELVEKYSLKGIHFNRIETIELK